MSSVFFVTHTQHARPGRSTSLCLSLVCALALARACVARARDAETVDGGLQVHATAGKCLGGGDGIDDCASRQHIVLNLVFVNSTWRARLPRSALLYNLEQVNKTKNKNNHNKMK